MLIVGEVTLTGTVVALPFEEVVVSGSKLVLIECKLRVTGTGLEPKLGKLVERVDKVFSSGGKLELFGSELDPGGSELDLSGIEV